jgi:serine/threonine-protein kinase
VVLLVLVGVLLPLTAYLTDPDRQRECIERRLARGEAVTLIGETGSPRWFRWRTNDERAKAALAADGTFSVQDWDLGLLELVRDPQRERYRFHVQVRHDTTREEGRVGIYFAHSLGATARGARRQYFCTVTFNDVRETIPQRGKGNPLELNLERCPDTQIGEQSHRVTIRQSFFKPAQALPDSGPWCQVVVEVRPHIIRISWHRTGEGRRASLELSRTELTKEARQIVVDAGDDVPSFSPRGGLGLFVYQGSASFRQAVIEPLFDGN